MGDAEITFHARCVKSKDERPISDRGQLYCGVIAGRTKRHVAASGVLWSGTVQRHLQPRRDGSGRHHATRSHQRGCLSA